VVRRGTGVADLPLDALVGDALTGDVGRRRELGVALGEQGRGAAGLEPTHEAEDALDDEGDEGSSDLSVVA
jgi:hypothetical protein